MNYLWEGSVNNILVGREHWAGSHEECTGCPSPTQNSHSDLPVGRPLKTVTATYPWGGHSNSDPPMGRPLKTVTVTYLRGSHSKQSQRPTCARGALGWFSISVSRLSFTHSNSENVMGVPNRSGICRRKGRLIN